MESDYSVKFRYNDQYILTFKCKPYEEMKTLCQNFAKKIDKDITQLSFIYNGTEFNQNYSLIRLATNEDERNKMEISVFDVKTISIINRKCSICDQIYCIKINKYNVSFECKNCNKNDNRRLDELENLNQSKIKCSYCLEIYYDYKLYFCKTCQSYFCFKCQENHKTKTIIKRHEIINYEKKNFICKKHCNNYSSYCKICKQNLCDLCKKDHNCCKSCIIKEYKYDNDNKSYNKLKNTFNKFKENIELEIMKLEIKIKELINKKEIYSGILKNLEIYFKINDDVYNKIKNGLINFEVLKNISQIKEFNEKVMSDLKDKSIYNVGNIYSEMKNINNEIDIKYKIKENKKEIQIFGKEFVNNNKDNFRIFINDKIYNLCQKVYIKNFNEKDYINIKLKGVILNTDVSYMFNDCNSLISISISEWNTSNIVNMSYMFSGCVSLSSIDGISNWNTSNVLNISDMFFRCSKLSYLPISKWDISKVIDMSGTFYGLQNLPDISNWNTTNVKNMRSLFSHCKFLPKILKWNTSNVANMSNIFSSCQSYLPDISDWDTGKVRDMSYMFFECSLDSLPDISKWNISNVKNMKFMFCDCKLEKKKLYITNWDTSNVIKNNKMLYNCKNIVFTFLNEK